MAAAYRAMQRYGLIVADNGSNWYFLGAPSRGWDDDDLNQLKSISGRVTGAAGPPLTAVANKLGTPMRRRPPPGRASHRPRTTTGAAPCRGTGVDRCCWTERSRW